MYMYKNKDKSLRRHKFNVHTVLTITIRTKRKTEVVYYLENHQKGHPYRNKKEF